MEVGTGEVGHRADEVAVDQAERVRKGRVAGDGTRTHPEQVGPGQVSPAEVRTLEVRPGQVRPGEVGV